MILLTGATGFIGGHLLDELIKVYGKENVIALTSKPITKCRFLLHNDYFINSGLQQIETIIHAGAFTPKSPIESNDIKRCNSNIFNTFSLISTQLPNIKNFVFLSTLDIYGYDNPITENSIEKPSSLYGHSKLYCEKLLSAWASQNKIAHQILRIGHVYGPGEEKYNKIIPSTMQRLLNGDTIQLYGEGKEIRSFIYISDVVQAIMNAIELKNKSDVINIVGQESITISELIDKIIDISNLPVTIENIKSESKTRDYIFENKKMKELLYTPKVGLNEGLLLEWNYMQTLNR